MWKYAGLPFLIILLLILFSCSLGNEVLPPSQWIDGNIVLYLQMSYPLDETGFIGYIFQSDQAVNDLSSALGVGLSPGFVDGFTDQILIRDKDGFGDPVIFSGGEKYIVLGHLDCDNNKEISAGDYLSSTDMTLIVDGQTEFYFRYPSEFSLVELNQGPRVAISLDSVKYISGDSVNLGTFAVDTENRITFTLFNSGDEDVNLSADPDFVKIFGTDQDSFPVVQQPQSTITAGSSQSLVININPNNTGELTAGFSIEHTGLNVSPFILNLSVQSIHPSAAIPYTGAVSSQIEGDDGDIQRGVSWPDERFIDNDDGTISDALTGLMWEKNPSSATRIWIDSLSWAESVTTGGFSDWRLPNVNELASLLSTDTYDNETRLESFGFSNIQENYYWSSTTFAPDETYAWIVDFGPASSGSGSVDKFKKTGEYHHIYILETYYSWCVRNGNGGVIEVPKTGQSDSWADGDDGDLEAGVSWPEPRFADNDNGTVTDLLTGLIWELSPAGNTMIWEDAVSGAVNLNTGGYSDWRLPNRSELRSLINYGSSNSIEWLSTQGFESLYEFYYWTSTPYPAGSTYSWIVFMTRGQVLMEYKVPGSGFWKPAWYVRGGY